MGKAIYSTNSDILQSFKKSLCQYTWLYAEPGSKHARVCSRRSGDFVTIPTSRQIGGQCVGSRDRSDASLSVVKESFSPEPPNIDRGLTSSRELVTLVERVADDNPEAIAANQNGFTRKQHALEEAGARVIRAPAKRAPDGGFKQSDDQRLVIATLSLALRLRPDFVVLAAADGDFAPMVWELRNEGIRTEVLARPQMLASDLRRAAYSIIDLDEVLNRVGGAH